MLEILSHQYLKKFLRDQSINWDHIYSFGRIVSKCIENDSTYLINSEIFSSNIALALIPAKLDLLEGLENISLQKGFIESTTSFEQGVED